MNKSPCTSGAAAASVAGGHAAARARDIAIIAAAAYIMSPASPATRKPGLSDAAASLSHGDRGSLGEAP